MLLMHFKSPIEKAYVVTFPRSLCPPLQERKDTNLDTDLDSQGLGSAFLPTQHNLSDQSDKRLEINIPHNWIRTRARIFFLFPSLLVPLTSYLLNLSFILLPVLLF